MYKLQWRRSQLKITEKAKTIVIAPETIREYFRHSQEKLEFLF